MTLVKNGCEIVVLGFVEVSITSNGRYSSIRLTNYTLSCLSKRREHSIDFTTKVRKNCTSEERESDNKESFC